jgi:hypothetical protein
MASASTSISTAPSTRGTGKKTSSTATEGRSGPTGQHLKATMLMARKREEGPSHGRMGAPTQGIFQKIISTEEVSTNGPMGEFTRALG